MYSFCSDSSTLQQRLTFSFLQTNIGMILQDLAEIEISLAYFMKALKYNEALVGSDHLLLTAAMYVRFRNLGLKLILHSIDVMRLLLITACLELGKKL
jgi:hypothetical protein